MTIASVEDILSGIIHNRLPNYNLVISLINFAALNDDIENRILLHEKSKDKIITDSVDYCRNLYDFLKTTVTAPVLWFLFEDYYVITNKIIGNNYQDLVDNINSSLVNWTDEQFIFLDLKRIVASIGIVNAYDQKMKYRWGCPYSKEMMNEIAAEVNKQYQIINGLSPKCLVLDCDNTLWKGILSEDGSDGISIGTIGIGSMYREFQRFVLTLYCHGVILAVCSKNDYNDVIGVFRNHDGMVLKEEHISCFKVNWENKADNIKLIADELNISIDSMVFVDDSPYECDFVKKMLPEIHTILFDTKKIYNDLSCFNLRLDVKTDVIRQRIDTYRSNSLRKKLELQCSNYEEYLKALDVNIRIENALPTDLGRISELSFRTNKCTNGVRLSLIELKNRMNSPEFQILTVHVADKFSDLGLVGAIIISSTLELFCLSCRALGRNVENNMLNYIYEKYGLISFKFCDTGKNKWLKSKMSKVLEQSKMGIEL